MAPFTDPAFRNRLARAANVLAEEGQLDLVVVFGSVARGDRAHPADVDIALRGAYPIDVVAATNRLIALLGAQDIDVVDLRRANPVLAATVARDGIPLFEDQPGRFHQFISLAMRRFADTRKFRDAEAGQLRAFAASHDHAE